MEDVRRLYGPLQTVRPFICIDVENGRDGPFDPRLSGLAGRVDTVLESILDTSITWSRAVSKVLANHLADRDEEAGPTLYCCTSYKPSGSGCRRPSLAPSSSLEAVCPFHRDCHVHVRARVRALALDQSQIRADPAAREECWTSLTKRRTRAGRELEVEQEAGGTSLPAESGMEVIPTPR